MHTGGRRSARLLIPLGALGIAGLLVVPPAQASGNPSGLTVRASVDGRPLAEADANDPLVLRPSGDTLVEVSVTNTGSARVLVRSVRLDARVLGLVFFSYTTRVDLTIEPGGSGARRFELDLSDLDGQATGLLPAELALVSPDRETLFTQDATVDVKGKLLSVYGVFGLAVAGITALLLGALGLRLVRRTLPDQRWARALQFAVPGLGLGMVVVFTLGVLRVLVPSLGTALGLLAGGLAVGFGLGYLTPAPGDEADRDELDERDVVDVVDVVELVPAPAPPTAQVTQALDLTGEDDSRRTGALPTGWEPPAPPPAPPSTQPPALPSDAAPS
jgi:hypothetical protein